MKRINRNRTVAFAIVLIVAMVAVWWFWPRPDPKIIITWQGKPQFTQNRAP